MAMSIYKRDRQQWVPPHCPNRHCPFHHSPHGWRWRKHGTFRRQKPPYVVQRYRCMLCGRCFSTQTFRTTYWHHKPHLQRWIFKLTVGGMANRQIARALGCAPSTVDHELAHLGRHCACFQRQQLRGASPPDDIVADGLVSYEHSKFFKFEHLIAVERKTGYIPYFTDAPLRRSGRMTDEQKQQRDELEALLGKPDPKAVEKGMRELLEVTLRGAVRAVVRTDKHKAYPRAMRGLACEIEHRQTDSRDVRDCHNELWEINILDTFVRHSSANHRRKTIALSKRRQGSAERLLIFTVWRNSVKKRRELGDNVTPAMLKGVEDRPLTERDILRKRLFPDRCDLPPRWLQYYWREVQTPVLDRNRGHLRKYAF